MKKTKGRKKSRIPLSDDPLWYKDAVIYELHVRAFHDSNGDGIGDFRGLAEKLDYLQDLGVTALWLLPFYPSPLRDDGYDIAEYTSIHPNYGTLSDFKHFLREAHSRDLRVITELVINHTSDQHPWFQKARTAKKGSRWRDFYVWTDDPNQYRDTRIIFQDFETSNWTWDDKAQAYYWHRFYSHQPDLNFDNAAVKKALFKVLDFWLDMGVDGLRLDAVPYLYEREDTNCENLPETHDFLKELRRHVDRRHKNKMLLAEANMWPEDAAQYFGEGDGNECHMNFHFPLMPRMFMAIQMEDHFPIVDILQQTPEIPQNSQWALFLRNHDELTLEMVTDEDRDYMYRVFAGDPQARINVGIRRRLAPLLDNNRRRIELLNGLLFSLPGTPVMYYADEIGMGDNIYLGDRNGVRTPMQWSGDRNAGFSRTNPQRLFLPVVVDPQYHYEALNVETQQQNTHSLLWWMKRLIDLRKKHPVFGRGSMEVLPTPNRRILAFLREHEGDRILIVANLSRFAQSVHLDLSRFRGKVLRELFGQSKFPTIRQSPYFLSLGPHEFFWFGIERAKDKSDGKRNGARVRLPVLRVRDSWIDALEDPDEREILEAALEKYLPRQRWFRGKSRTLMSLKVKDVVLLEKEPSPIVFLLLRVTFSDHKKEDYTLFLTREFGARREDSDSIPRQAVVAKLKTAVGNKNAGELVDAASTSRAATVFFDFMVRRRKQKGSNGQLSGSTHRALSSYWKRGDPIPPASLMTAEQSNTSIRFGQDFILKIYRQVETGENPDLEIGRYLNRTSLSSTTSPICASISYERPKGAMTIGTLQKFIPNQGDAWKYTLDNINDYFDRVLGRDLSVQALPDFKHDPFEWMDKELDPDLRELFGSFPLLIEKLAQQNAELHIALASGRGSRDFSAESFPPHYQRSLYQTVRSQVQDAFHLLEDNMRSLSEDDRTLAKELIENKSELLKVLRAIMNRKISGKRIRCHGDLHLGQILFTGKDFVFIDFEGEPTRPISERRIKRSPLRDISGMLRSFQYAAVTGLRDERIRVEDRERLRPYAELWSSWINATYLRTYLEGMNSSGLLPKTTKETKALLDLYLIEKGAYEIRYELDNRPEWIDIPIRGLLYLLKSSTD